MFAVLVSKFLSRSVLSRSTPYTFLAHFLTPPLITCCYQQSPLSSTGKIHFRVLLPPQESPAAFQSTTMKFISSFLLSGVLSLTSSSAFVVTNKGVSSPSIFAPAMQPLVVPVLPASRGTIGSTALQMAFPTGDALAANRKDEVFKLIDELAVEGEDPDEAKKLIESVLSSSEQKTVTVGDMAIATLSEEEDMRNLSRCDEAVVALTIDIIGLIMTIIGLPSNIGKRAAKKIAQKAGKKLAKEVTRIASQYFRDSADLLSVATGVWEFLQALLTIISIDNLIGTIIGEMSWWEVILYGALVAAQVALLFAGSVATIVVKLALATPDIVDVATSTFKVVEECD